MILFALLSITAAAPAASPTMTITGISDSTADGRIPLAVTLGDLDGDGAADRGTLFLHCAGGKVSEALFADVRTAREAGSGMATGRRTHVVPHVLEVSSTSRLGALRLGYDLKKADSVRVALGGKKGYDHYQTLSLHGADDLCPAAAEEAAKVKATKSRSNIQNN